MSSQKTHPEKRKFSRDYRIRYRWEFRKFFVDSEKYRFFDCVVYRIPNSLEHFRLGITVKTRCSSVERNQIKRRLRESFRSLSPILGSYDYNVVIPKGTKLGRVRARKIIEVLLSSFPKKLEGKKER